MSNSSPSSKKTVTTADTLDTITSVSPDLSSGLISGPTSTVRETKPSFIKLPDPKGKNSLSSGLVTVVQEQADSDKAVHLLQLANPNLSPSILSLANNSDMLMNLPPTSPSQQQQQQQQQQQLSYLQQPVQQQQSLKPETIDESALSVQTTPTVAEDDKIETESPINMNNLRSNWSTTVDPASSTEDGLSVMTGSATMNTNSGNAVTPVNSTPTRNKKTNPSLLNLRGIAAQQGNYNTISSQNTVQSKNSSRAEFFAAKVHNAIKDDEKYKSDSDETFVYETATKDVPSEPVILKENASSANTLSQQSPILQSRNTIFKDNQSTSSLSDTVVGQSRFGSTISKESNTQNKGNANSTPTFETEDTLFDTRSRSSTHNNYNNNTNNIFRKSSRIDPLTSLEEARAINQQQDPNPELVSTASELQSNLTNDQQSQTPSQALASEPFNNLRQITSRIFDSKGVHPRRYSGMDIKDMAAERYEDDGFDEDDDLMMGLGVAGYGLPPPTSITNHNSQQQQQQQNYGSISDYDSDYGDDDLSVNEATFKNVNDHSIQCSISLNHGHASNNPYQQPLLDSPLGNKYGFNYDSIGNNNASNNVNNVHSIGGSVNRLKRKRNNNDLYYFSPHDFTSARTARFKQLKNFCYTFLFILMLLLLGFMGGFILATSKELQHTSILNVYDVLISDQEFVFSMELESFNPGFLDVVIQNVELDFFAKTSRMSSTIISSSGSDNSYDTTLLGTVNHLDIPFYLQGGFITRQFDISSTEIKIVNPCSFDHDDDTDGGDDDDQKGKKPKYQPATLPSDDKDNDEDESRLRYGYNYNYGSRNNYVDITKAKSGTPIIEPNPKWLNISKSPFELIVRGVLNYQLPVTGSNRTVGVNYSYEIDPNNLVSSTY